MKAGLTAEGDLRFEPETKDDRKYLSRLHAGIMEQYDAYWERFRQTNQPKSILRRLLLVSTLQKRGWSQPRVSSAHYHDGSLILKVDNGARTER
jgi:hypothetical protein